MACPRDIKAERRLTGIPVSPGVAMGSMRLVCGGDTSPDIYPITEDELEGEWGRFEAALALTREQIENLKKRVTEMTGAKEAEIFDAHLLFLLDKSVMESIRSELRVRRQNVEAVAYAVIQTYIEAMRRVDDPYLRARTSDFEDVLHRLLENLHHSSASVESFAPVSGGAGDSGSAGIVGARDLTPSDTAALDTESVLGFATELGSTNSHTAILARSMGIPAVVGVPRLLLDTCERQYAVLDGYKGVLILNPEPETKEYYERLRAEKNQFYKALEAMHGLPTETKDGRRMRLAANVEFAHEYANVVSSGAEGVGLYRTEFFLLGDRGFPDEDEQADHYAALARACAPHEVVFRTFDAGGDKLPVEQPDAPEDNPFLGWRGIRVSLSRPELFKIQLRAILRASSVGKCSIMYPMISGITEVRLARELLEECKAELRREGRDFDEHIRTGIMIEVPGAAAIADVLADEVDFFSIGTNDLTQYTIAVDRVNFRVAHMFRSSHPGVIRLINKTIADASAKNIPTAICGEMAGDIAMLPLLVGMGASELSVGVHHVPIIRYAVRNLNYWECRDMVREALQAKDSSTIKALSKGLAMRSYPDLFD